LFVDCNVFVYCIIFFLLGYSKFLHQKRYVLGSKGGWGEGISVQLCSASFVSFLFFKRGALWRENWKKLNNFETGLKLSQYFDPSWSRSGPIFVGAILVAAQTETDVGFTLYIKNSWPQYSNDLQGRA